MATGTVKWFNNAKGFGFICPEGEDGDIFAHYSTIQMDGYRTLKAGQQVSYQVEQGPILRDTTRAVLCQSRDNQQNSGLIATLACFGNLQSTKIETRPIGRVLFWCLN